jgi:hypothetical protein
MDKKYIKVKITLGTLFKKLGVKDFKTPSVLPVDTLGIRIKSFDTALSQDVFSLIKDLVVKAPVPYHFILKSLNGQELKTSSHHKSYKDKEWVESFKRFELEEDHLKVEKPLDIVDLTVKNTECYYANGQLNHNTTPGGNALKFYASMRIDIRKKTAIKQGDRTVGNITKVKIVKSKVSPPFRETEVSIISPYGIDIIGDILDKAVDFKVIKQGGAWFTYKEDRWQGRDSVTDTLKKDPIFLDQVKSEVLVAMKENKEVVKEKEVLPQLV